MNRCAIIIPVYKEALDKYERLSFEQCLKVLHSYDLILVTYEELNLDQYFSIASDYNKSFLIEKFKRDFFDNIEAYNKLMKSLTFYKRFKNYEFILVYQLDAFVFKDELAYWCDQSYDFIGAPWFQNYKSFEEGFDIMAVGNGGFSLRKVSYFIKVLSWKWPVIKPNFSAKFRIKDFLKQILFFVGRNNTIKYYLLNDPVNEDIFFTQFLRDSWIKPKLPNIQDAIRFSFEKSPTYLYTLNEERLPFGCHSYLKNEYDLFWQRFIEDESLNHYN